MVYPQLALLPFISNRRRLTDCGQLWKMGISVSAVHSIRTKRFIPMFRSSQKVCLLSNKILKSSIGHRHWYPIVSLSDVITHLVAESSAENAPLVTTVYGHTLTFLSIKQPPIEAFKLAFMQNLIAVSLSWVLVFHGCLILFCFFSQNFQVRNVLSNGFYLDICCILPLQGVDLILVQLMTYVCGVLRVFFMLNLRKQGLSNLPNLQILSIHNCEWNGMINIPDHVRVFHWTSNAGLINFEGYSEPG